jgi:hypothetical protein
MMSPDRGVSRVLEGLWSLFYYVTGPDSDDQGPVYPCRQLQNGTDDVSLASQRPI